MRGSLTDKPMAAAVWNVIGLSNSYRHDLPHKFGSAELTEKLAVSGKNVYNYCCMVNYILRQGGIR